MGPLTRLIIGKRGIESYFTKDGDRFIVYPYWIFGRGFRIDRARRDRIERLNCRLFEVLFWGALAYLTLAVLLLALADHSTGHYIGTAVFGVFVVTLLATHTIASGKVLAGSERTPKRMTLDTHLEKAAAYLSWPRVVIGLASVIILNLMPVNLLLFFPQFASGLDLLALGIGQVVFLALLWIHVRIVICKRQSKADFT